MKNDIKNELQEKELDNVVGGVIRCVQDDIPDETAQTQDAVLDQFRKTMKSAGEFIKDAGKGAKDLADAYATVNTGGASKAAQKATKPVAKPE